MNTLLNNLKKETNFTHTENGAVAYASTLNSVLDLFALGGAYRSRTEAECIKLFRKAYAQNAELALKCLFYIRDIREGQGERRFFRVCLNWLANKNPEVVKKNLTNIAIYGRYDDLYCLVDTPVERDMFRLINHQLRLDLICTTPSLLAKWVKSENCSSKESKRLANRTREALGLSHKDYRKMLSLLRKRINIVENLMRTNQWDKIVYDKIPSKAGLIYRNAFAKHDEERYKAFIENKKTKVNAGALYPYEIIQKVRQQTAYYGDTFLGTDLDRAALNKYWENQKDVLEGKPCKMICVVDTSGSMVGIPIDIAIGLGMYCAERVGGPFKNHYISFSSRPQLIEIDETKDFVDRVLEIYKTNLCENTDLVATFKLLKKATIAADPEDRLDSVIVISDMEIDLMSENGWTEDTTATEMEKIREEWEAEGLKMPKLVYWNCFARNDVILDLSPDVSFVSGSSPSIFKQIVTGKTGWDLFMETVGNNPRYDAVTI